MLRRLTPPAVTKPGRWRFGRRACFIMTAWAAGYVALVRSTGIPRQLAGIVAIWTIVVVATWIVAGQRFAAISSWAFAVIFSVLTFPIPLSFGGNGVNLPGHIFYFVMSIAFHSFCALLLLSVAAVILWSIDRLKPPQE